MTRCSAIVLLIGISRVLSAQQNSDGSRYEVHERDRPRVMIFVHGFTGTAIDTWRGAPDKPGFPALIATDERVKQSNVFVASYDTKWKGDNSTIQDVTYKLFRQLDDANVFADHKELVFVCHSLGGLIVERMLVDHKEVAAKTAFIQFYGTPHEGVLSEVKLAHPLLPFATVFGFSTIIPELRPGSDNAGLVKLDSDWRAAGFSNIRRFCAVEMRQSYLAGGGAIVVPYFSASFGCDTGVPIDRIDSDHSGMVKVSGRTPQKAPGGGLANEAYLILLRNYRDNPYTEWRTSNPNDSHRDISRYFVVDCERTTSDPALPVTFFLDTSAREELLGAVAELRDKVNIKDESRNPLKVVQVNASTVNVSFGFNGLDKTAGNCPGGGHATVVVHPTIRTRVTIADGN